jgi:hypothetical protein
MKKLTLLAAAVSIILAGCPKDQETIGLITEKSGDAECLGSECPAGTCNPGDEQPGKSDQGHRQKRFCNDDGQWSRWISTPLVNGYQEAEFGMTRAQVEKLYKGRESETIDGNFIVVDKFQDETISAGFIFYDEKLYQVALLFDTDGLSEDDAIDKYDHLSEVLNDKYGAPFTCDDEDYPLICMWFGEPGEVILLLSRQSSDKYSLAVRYHDPVVSLEAQRARMKEAQDKQ